MIELKIACLAPTVAQISSVVYSKLLSSCNFLEIKRRNSIIPLPAVYLLKLSTIALIAPHLI